MERAGDRPGYVLGAHRLLDRDRVVAGEPVQPAGQERLEREVPAILLADETTRGRPVDPGGRERGDRVSETGRRVEDGERRLPARDREAGRHSDDGALVQAEHEAKVVREIREQRHLGRPGFANIVVKPSRRRTSNVAARTVRRPTGSRSSERMASGSSEPARGARRLGSRPGRARRRRLRTAVRRVAAVDRDLGAVHVVGGSDRRNRTSDATSSGVPSRPAGVRSSETCRYAGAHRPVSASRRIRD